MAYRTAIAILVLALATASGVSAQTPASDPIQPVGTAPSAPIDFTGVVVSSSDNQLVLRNDAGKTMTFVIDANTAEPRTFTVGDRVTTTYANVAGTGYVVSRSIVLPGGVTATQTTTTVTTPAPAVSATATTYDTDADADVATTAADEDVDETLPATASPLPLAALLGLLAAAGAAASRRFRRNS
jgi:hypothetical protein